MKKNITIVAVILGALGLIAFTLNKNKTENKAKTDIVAEKNAAVSVKTAQVKTEEVSLDFLANGKARGSNGMWQAGYSYRRASIGSRDAAFHAG